jgi:hypothetical protein
MICPKCFEKQRDCVCATTGENVSAPADSSVKRRRVIVDIRVEGTDEDAQKIQDAIGAAINDEVLMPACVEVMELRDIADVKWEVRGERWVSQNAGGQP